MADTAVSIEIPDRALFKAAEVCDLVQVQPYVLRTWEAEFPNLGVAKSAGSARVYRREDVEQVVRIKHLLLIEGLTLAGARRKIEADAEPSPADLPEVDTLLTASTRQRLTSVKQGLRSILELLTAAAPVSEFTLTPAPVAPNGAGRAAVASDFPGESRAKSASPRAASPRTKRST
jgi:DNA-binding transcriptional MerR regulator